MSRKVLLNLCHYSKGDGSYQKNQEFLEYIEGAKYAFEAEKTLKRKQSVASSYKDHLTSKNKRGENALMVAAQLNISFQVDRTHISGSRQRSSITSLGDVFVEGILQLAHKVAEILEDPTFVSDYLRTRTTLQEDDGYDGIIYLHATALFFASKNEDHDILNRLLDEDSELLGYEAPEADGKKHFTASPFYGAVCENHLRNVKILTRRAGARAASYLNDAESIVSPLDAATRAAFSGDSSEVLDSSMVDFLLENGAMPVREGKNLIYNALHHAVWYGSDEIVKKFIDAIHRKYSASELSQQTLEGSTNCLSYQTDDVDGGGWTALYCAVERGHHNIVKMLVLAGADIDKGGAARYTPLYKACRICDIHMIHFLLGMLADPTSAWEYCVKKQALPLIAETKSQIWHEKRMHNYYKGQPPPAEKSWRTLSHTRRRISDDRMLSLAKGVQRTNQFKPASLLKLKVYQTMMLLFCTRFYVDEFGELPRPEPSIELYNESGKELAPLPDKVDREWIKSNPGTAKHMQSIARRNDLFRKSYSEFVVQLCESAKERGLGEDTPFWNSVIRVKQIEDLFKIYAVMYRNLATRLGLAWGSEEPREPTNSGGGGESKQSGQASIVAMPKLRL